MYVKKNLSQTTVKHGIERQATWHVTLESTLFTFTKKLNTRCGKHFLIVDEAVKVKSRLTKAESAFICQICTTLGKGSIMSKWSSTGYGR